jgi:glucose/arabinose dehydrogenase
MSRPRTVRLLAAISLATVLASAFASNAPAAAAPIFADGARVGAAVVRTAVDAAPINPTTDGSTVLASPTDAHIHLRLLASGLSKPVFATSARDGTGRIFIVEQTGKIKILKNGLVRSTPFLNLTSQVSRGGEQGLLGLAFHPNFTTNRKLYVNFTNVAGNTIIREYRASSTNPNVVATSTARRILKIDQPYANHNGGMLAFGPDGYLYIGMGDGGGAGDPGNRAQNKGSLLGKLLRININGTTATRAYRIPSGNPYVGAAGANEIWQLGLRNPWRFSFDRATGNLWIGDVGQGRYEEVDRAVRTSSGAGKGVNWGWRVLEGSHCYSPSTGCSTAGKTMPLLDYDHANGRCAVTGGYVYRGSAIPVLRGGYVFADYCSGEIWVVPAGAGAPASKVSLLDTNLLISSFGENARGELFVTDLNGRLYRIDPA